LKILQQIGHRANLKVALPRLICLTASRIHAQTASSQSCQAYVQNRSVEVNPIPEPFAKWGADRLFKLGLAYVRGPDGHRTGVDASAFDE
jgi:hypothetical protein